MMTVSLTQEQWNNILMLLAEHPYKVSAPLIQSVTNCLRDQMQEQPQPQQLRANGSAEPHRPGA
jgi:hypothetical protein